MPLSTAAKAALCLCPTAAVVGTAATVPAAKRAVHHLTAPHRPVARHRPHVAPAQRVAQREDCAPILAGPLPVAPIVTYAAPIPDEPGVPGDLRGPIGGTPITVLGAEAPVPVVPSPGGGVPGNPGTPGGGGPGTPAPAVPEPASWLLMILGVGAVGGAVRARRRTVGRVAAASGLWTAGGIAEAGDATMSVAMQAGAGKSILASAAGKAALCVCPAALVAGSVVAVPPLRHAVHAATAPAGIPAAPAARPGPVPCDRPIAVPVSAAAVNGYPAVVTTAAK